MATLTRVNVFSDKMGKIISQVLVKLIKRYETVISVSVCVYMCESVCLRNTHEYNVMIKDDAIKH